MHNDAIPWASGRTDDSAAQLQEWTALSSWLDANYHYEARIEDFELYRMNHGDTETRRAERVPGQDEQD
jgi:hypothetical protein